MTVTDTGVLVAILIRNESKHAACVAIAARLPHGQLMTTWPCLTEAMHLLHRAGGYAAQAALWRMISAGDLTIWTTGDEELPRIQWLMNKHRDLPMDLADATLISAAEQLGTRRIFTIDSDFHIYRFADGSTVEVLS